MPDRTIKDDSGNEIDMSAFKFSSYRKKPVVISACKLVFPVTVITLEGEMKGDIGDWLIMGVKGELYPCKDDIFKQTYAKL